MINLDATTMRYSELQNLAATDKTWLGFYIFSAQHGRGTTHPATSPKWSISVNRRLDLAGFEVASNDNVEVRIDGRTPRVTTDPAWDSFGGF